MFQSILDLFDFFQKDDTLFKIKITVLGEESVGKTNLINRYVKDKFLKGTNQHCLTNMTKKIKLKNGHKYLLDFKDTKGSSSFREINKLYYREAEIIIIVFDITNKKSYDEVELYWVSEVMKEVGMDRRSKTNIIITLFICDSNSHSWE